MARRAGRSSSRRTSSVRTPGRAPRSSGRRGPRAGLPATPARTTPARTPPRAPPPRRSPRCSAGPAVVGTTIGATSAAATRNDAASTSTTASSPNQPSSAAPSGTPLSRPSRLFSAFIAFACTNSSRGTSVGSRAASAGIENAETSTGRSRRRRRARASRRRGRAGARGRRPLGQRGDHQHPLAVPPVGEDAGHGREQDRRSELGCGHPGGRDRGVRADVDVVRQGGHQHPVPGNRDQAGEPEESEVAPPEDGEHHRPSGEGSSALAPTRRATSRSESRRKTTSRARDRRCRRNRRPWPAGPSCTTSRTGRAASRLAPADRLHRRLGQSEPGDRAARPARRTPRRWRASRAYRTSQSSFLAGEGPDRHRGVAADAAGQARRPPVAASRPIAPRPVRRAREDGARPAHVPMRLEKTGTSIGNRVVNPFGSQPRQRNATSAATCRKATVVRPQSRHRSRVGRQPASSRRTQPSAIASSRETASPAGSATGRGRGSPASRRLRWSCRAARRSRRGCVPRRSARRAPRGSRQAAGTVRGRAARPALHARARCRGRGRRRVGGGEPLGRGSAAGLDPRVQPAAADVAPIAESQASAPEGSVSRSWCRQASSNVSCARSSAATGRCTIAVHRRTSRARCAAGPQHGDGGGRR